MLIANYYTIIKSEQLDERTFLFRFTLNPEAEVYRGHFPDNPIAPGVCTLQMIKECLQNILDRDTLRLSPIRQCRFTRLLRPSDKQLELYVRLMDDRWFAAEILEDGQTCMKLKAQYN